MTGSEYICAPELVRAFFPCFYSSVTKRKQICGGGDRSGPINDEMNMIFGSVMHSLYTLNHAYGRGSVCPIDERGYDDPDSVLPVDNWKQ